MRRSSAALVGVRAWEVGRSSIPVVLASVIGPPEYLRTPWLIFVIVFSASSLYGLFFDWLTVRYCMDDDGVVYESGWPSRTRRQIGWQEADAVRVDQDLAHRVLRRYKVTVTVGAEQCESIVIAALSRQDADLLVRLHRDATTLLPSDEKPSESGSEESREGVSDSRLLHRTSWRDHLVIAFTYGHFILVVPFLIGGYHRVAEWISLPGEDDVALWLLAHLPVTITALLACAFLYGVAHSYLKFGGHVVRVIDGGYEVRSGIFEHSTHRVQLDAVLGVRIDQNPVMVLFGMASLRLVLRNSHGEAQSLMILPVAPMSTVEEQVRRILPDASMATDRPGWPVPVAVLVLGGGLVSGAMIFGQHWGVASLLLIVTLWLANRWTAAWGRREECVVFRRGVCFVRRYVLRPEAIRLTESWMLRSRPAVLRVVILDEVPSGLLAPHVTKERAASLESFSL
ncbi:PH domain-containing protein [Arachnia propionica]|uniref:PH domain-containing protein n=1 Tax=Arachnia propionica TaxID=1750 RepID=UPI0030CB3D6B